MNPNQKVPFLAFDTGEYLAESNAILCHLAEGTPLLPASGLARSRVLSWLFFEQYSHEPYLAMARYILRHTPPDSPRRAELPHRKSEACRALGILEIALTARDYLIPEGLSIADLALFAYTHRSEEAEITLSDYPAILAWIERVRAPPRFVPMFG